MAIGETEKEFQINWEKNMEKKEVGSSVIDFLVFYIFRTEKVINALFYLFRPETKNNLIIIFLMIFH